MTNLKHRARYRRSVSPGALRTRGQGGKVKVVSLLLDAGAELEARTGTHGTPLLWGCMGGHPDVIRHLLERGANVAAVTRVRGRNKRSAHPNA